MSTTLPAEGTEIGTAPPATSGGTPLGLFLVEWLSAKSAGKSKFPNGQGIYEDQVAVTWKIRKVIDGDKALVGTTFTRYAAYKMSPRANLRLWLEAHAQRKIQDGEAFDVSQVRGTIAKAHIAQKQGQNGMETHVTLAPYEGKGGAKSVPQPAPAPEPVDDPEGFTDDEDDLDF